MKHLLILFSIVISTNANAQSKDSTGNVGDNLDLQGVMELFKNAQNLEEFEKAINTESNHVNNLDLNKDGETDYIRVIDRVDSNAHAITLQVPVNESESQDVAVIILEMNGNESAIIQIQGDDELYDDDYLIEPYEPQADYVTKNEYDETSAANTKKVVNVYAWPCVRYVYGPRYSPYVSPWRFRAYPVWFRPWRPVAWRIHHNRVKRYHAHYRVVRFHRARVAHRVYHRQRVRSAVYRHNHPRVKAAPRNNHPRQKAAGRRGGRGGGRRR
jgi:hypothetical protein